MNPTHKTTATRTEYIARRLEAQPDTTRRVMRDAAERMLIRGEAFLDALENAMDFGA